MKKSTIGWIGLGTMGVPMANSLLRNDYDLTVYNRNPEKVRTFEDQGAKVALTPADLISKVDTVIVMVTDDQAIKDILKVRKVCFQLILMVKQLLI